MVIRGASSENRGKITVTRSFRARRNPGCPGDTTVTARVAIAIASGGPSGSGAGGAYRRLTDGARLAHRAHLQIIRDDDAAEANLAAQVILHDQARERRWHAGGVQVRVDGM